MRSSLFFLLPVLLIPLLATASSTPIPRFSDAIQQPPPDLPDLIGLVEIPSGSANKYELDEATGLLLLDRVLALPLVYPAHYGMFPQTLAGDGDALDFLLLSRTPLTPGTLLRIRPVAVLRMRDNDQEDPKIIAVPALSVDAAFAHINDLPDLPHADLQRLEAFFRLYKAQADGTHPVHLDGFGPAAEATALIKEARLSWQASLK